MSKKKLDVSTITNELRGQSVFFPKNQKEQDDQEQQPTTPPLVEQKTNERRTMIPWYHGIMKP